MRRDDQQVSFAQILGRNNSGSLILESCGGSAFLVLRLPGRGTFGAVARAVEIRMKFAVRLPS